MILFFSGTGNSEYAARRIGQEIQEEAVNLFERLRDHDYSELHSESPWVIAAPTYAWRIPRILQTWLERTPFTGNRDIYFVMTCGANIANAGAYLEKLCAGKGMNYKGCMEVVMPENYVAMFRTPTKEEAEEIIARAEKKMDEAARRIKQGEAFPRPSISFLEKRESGMVNDVFYPLFVHAKKFYTTDACISCGKCVNACPLKNVHLENGKPVWGDQCTHCMACICRCPKEAIEYGRHSKGLPRYTCPK